MTTQSTPRVSLRFTNVSEIDLKSIRGSIVAIAIDSIGIIGARINAIGKNNLSGIACDEGAAGSIAWKIDATICSIEAASDITRSINGINGTIKNIGGISGVAGIDAAGIRGIDGGVISVIDPQIATERIGKIIGRSIAMAIITPIAISTGIGAIDSIADSHDGDVNVDASGLRADAAPTGAVALIPTA